MSDIACNEPVDANDISINLYMMGLAALMAGAVVNGGNGEKFPTSIGYNTDKIDEFVSIFQTFYEKQHMFSSLPFWDGFRLDGNNVSADEVTSAMIKEFFKNLRYNNQIINLYDDIFNNDTSLPRQTEVKNIIQNKLTQIIKNATQFFAEKNPILHTIPAANLHAYQSAPEYIRLREQSYIYYRNIFAKEWAAFFKPLEVPVRLPPPPKSPTRTAAEVAAEALKQMFNKCPNIKNKGGKALLLLGPLILFWRIAEARSTGETIDAVLQTLEEDLNWSSEPTYFGEQLLWRRQVRQVIELCSMGGYSRQQFLEIVQALAETTGREWNSSLETLVNEVYDDLQPVITDSIEYKKTIKRWKAFEAFAKEAMDAANEAWNNLEDNAPCNNEDVKYRMELLKLKLQQMEENLQRQIKNSNLPQVGTIIFKNVVDENDNLNQSMQNALQYFNQTEETPLMECKEQCCPDIIYPCDDEVNFMTSINTGYSDLDGGFSGIKDFSTGYLFYEVFPPTPENPKYIQLFCGDMSGSYPDHSPPDPEKTVALTIVTILSLIPTSSTIRVGYLYEEDLTGSGSYSIDVNSSTGNSGIVTITPS